MGLYRICTDANSTDCIESNTYDLSEIVTSVNSVCIRYLYKVKDANWTEDFAHSYTGRTYTLELPLKLRLRENFTNLLRIGLKEVIFYNFIIQDPKYIYVTDNPEPGHPSHRKEVDPADTSYYLIYSMFRLSLFWLNFGIFSTLAKYQIFIVYCHSTLGLFLEFSFMTIWESCIKLRGLKLKNMF